MNRILEEDYLLAASDNGINWDKLENRTVFVTGATGLIGSVLVHSLITADRKYGRNIKVVAMARSMEKAEKVFSDCMDDPHFEIYCGDINSSIGYEGSVDHIIHGASITSSKMMVEKPVDVISTAINGSMNILQFAVSKNAGVVYLSSMEIYGIPTTDDKITEKDYAYIDHLNVRSSYPESKKMVENLCVSFGAQYCIDVKIARLTQTFGAGVEFDDNRAFADFARNTVLERDIILHTKGETRRCYLYTADAVRAIIYIMLEGGRSEAYNAANEATYCTICEMAETAASLGENTKVVIEESDISAFGYAPTLRMNLDTSKLRALGWAPSFELRDMFSRMISSWNEEENN